MEAAKKLFNFFILTKSLKIFSKKLHFYAYCGSLERCTLITRNKKSLHSQEVFYLTKLMQLVRNGIIELADHLGTRNKHKNEA